jgi:hypothetical protein
MGGSDYKCLVFAFRHHWRRRRAGEYHWQDVFLRKNYCSNTCLSGIPSNEYDLCRHWSSPHGQRTSCSLLQPVLTHGSQAAKDASGSQDKLFELFNRIERFFRRLEIYTSITPTMAMTDITIDIMVEVLTILAIATKEAKRGQLSELISSRFTIVD